MLRFERSAEYAPAPFTVREECYMLGFRPRLRDLDCARGPSGRARITPVRQGVPVGRTHAALSIAPAFSISIVSFSALHGSLLTRTARTISASFLASAPPAAFLLFPRLRWRS